MKQSFGAVSFCTRRKPVSLRTILKLVFGLSGVGGLAIPKSVSVLHLLVLSLAGTGPALRFAPILSTPTMK